MIHKYKIGDIPISFNDGNKETEETIELHGELADKEEIRLVNSCIRTLEKRGYKVIKNEGN